MSSLRQTDLVERLDAPPRSRRILLVGASVRAAAESLRRAGWTPWCIDLFADSDLVAIAPTRSVPRLDRQLIQHFASFPAAPWMYAGGLENRPRLVARLSQLRPLLGNPAPVLQSVRSLDKLRTLVDSLGAPIPPYQSSVPDDVEDLPLVGEAVDRGRPNWIWKPWRSAGGLRVAWQETREQRRDESAASERRRELSGYWQRYISGRPCGATFVADGRQCELIGVCEQLSGPTWTESPGFLYGGSIGPLPIGAKRRELLERLGAAVAQRFGLVGLFGIDLIDAGERLWTLEVNPRYTASMELLERASGVSLAALHLAGCRRAWHEVRPEPERARVRADAALLHGKAIWYAREAGRVTPGLIERLERLRETQPWSGAADIPNLGAPLAAGVPIATLFASGSTADEVRQRLLAGLATLRRECAVRVVMNGVRPSG